MPRSAPSYRGRAAMGGTLLLALLVTATLSTQAADPSPAKDDDLRRQLEAANARAEKHLYLYRIALAQREWTAHDADRTEQILSECPASLRGWEWHYLRRLCETGLVTFHGHTKAISSLAFSPDGKRIASASLDGSVKVWDSATGKELLVFRKHRHPISHAAFSPDGKRIASAAYKMLKFSVGGSEDKGEGEVKVWEADTGKELLTIKREHDLSLVLFVGDGQRLVTQGGNKTLKVWDAASGKELMTLKGSAEEPRGLSVSPDGKRIASAIGKEGKPGEVKVWETDTGREVLSLREPAGPISGVLFSPDGKRLAGVGADQTIRIWDAVTGQQMLQWRTGSEQLMGLAFSPDGKRLATSGMDSLIKVWDADTGKELVTLVGHTDWVAALAFSPDGKRLASGSGNPLADLFGDFFGIDQKRPAPVAKVWDATGGQEVRTFSGHTAAVNGVAFSPDGKRLASAGEDGVVKVRDCAGGKEILAFKGQGSAAKCVSFSPDGQRLASGGANGTVKVWDAATGQEIVSLEGHSQMITAVAFSPDGKQLASAGSDQTAKVWDLQTGKEITTFKGHPGATQGVAFSPDGKRLASVSWGLISSSSVNGVSKTTKTSGDVHVWDLATNKELLTLKGGWLSAWAVAFSPDGKLLATAADDQVVRLWDSRTGTEVMTLKGIAGVSGLAFSPDGQRLITSGQSGIKVWDVATGLEALTFRGPHGSVALSAGGLLAAASNQDVKLWNGTPLSPEVLAGRSARAVVQRLFDEGLLRSEVLEKVKNDTQLDAVGRKVAVRLAEEGTENSSALNNAAWAVVKQPGQSEAAYALALRRAEAANRLVEENVNILHTLAVAQYRAGKYKEALASLKQVVKLRGDDGFGGHPLDQAYLAMTHHRLGNAKEARDNLEKLRQRASGDELQTLLREVETVLNVKEAPKK